MPEHQTNTPHRKPSKPSQHTRHSKRGTASRRTAKSTNAVKNRKSTENAPKRRPRRRRKNMRKPIIAFVIFIVVIFLIVGSIQWTSNKPHHQNNAFRIIRTRQEGPAKLSVKEKKEQQAKKLAARKKKLKTDLPQAWQTAAKDYTGGVEIAVHSEETGDTYTWSNAQQPRTYSMASTVKVSILAQLLHNRGGALSSGEQALAERMIEQSDNSAAQSLFNIVGSSGLNTLFSSLGMTHSTTASGGWGRTQTTPADQVILLNNIYYGSNYLNDASRSTISDLMSKVIPEQSWGISKGSKTYYLKNGWLNEPKGWIVNSIGFIPSTSAKAKNSYTIAVYTDANGSGGMAGGEAMIESLALETKKQLQPKAVVEDNDNNAQTTGNAADHNQ